jgi:hypothetical protein
MIFDECVLLICYFCFALPGASGANSAAVSLNVVFGLSDHSPQTSMPPLLWLAMVMVVLPFLTNWPTQQILLRIPSRNFKNNVTNRILGRIRQPNCLLGFG